MATSTLSTKTARRTRTRLTRAIQPFEAAARILATHKAKAYVAAADLYLEIAEIAFGVPGLEIPLEQAEQQEITAEQDLIDSLLFLEGDSIDCDGNRFELFYLKSEGRCGLQVRAL